MGSLGQFSPRLLTERVTMLLFFIPIAAATPLPSGGNSSALAAANCDPDYGWINGPEGSNKCYMYLKDTAYSACFPNHGFLAEPASQEEHDLIKQHLVIIDGADAYTSYWLGGSDFYEEGTFQWANGDPFTFTQWGEGEPNNSGDEDCIAMSSRNSYNWLDLDCATRDHSSEMHYAVCENRKG